MLLSQYCAGERKIRGAVICELQTQNIVSVNRTAVCVVFSEENVKYNGMMNNFFVKLVVIYKSGMHYDFHIFSIFAFT